MLQKLEARMAEKKQETPPAEIPRLVSNHPLGALHAIRQGMLARRVSGTSHLRGKRDR
jgi:hypothetical protein